MLVDVGPGRPEHVYLSDFGLARGMLSLGGPTMAGQFLGTPDYAAPEQISGRPVDGRVDQYALGCVAYTLLSGSLPFEREEPMAALYAHLFAPPPQVTSVRPDLPEAVDQVLARALAKAPEDRYASCGAFADALREALGVEPYDSSGPVRPPAQARVVAPAGPGDQRTVTAVSASADAGGPAASEGEPPATRAAVTLPLTVPPDSPATPLPAGTSARAPTATPPDPLPPPTEAGTWAAVVAADRAYYDSVRAVSDQDAASISFPAHVPERWFRLSGTKVCIGRRSVSRRIEPEIDLTGPPTDPGVSRRHAELIAGPDGSWSVVDPDSPNGIMVNGKDIPPGEAVPLRDGDRIHLGAWTVITITRG
jgi:FHA domain/Protein kinase domain